MRGSDWKFEEFLYNMGGFGYFLLTNWETTLFLPDFSERNNLSNPETTEKPTLFPYSPPGKNKVNKVRFPEVSLLLRLFCSEK